MDSHNTDVRVRPQQNRVRNEISELTLSNRVGVFAADSTATVADVIRTPTAAHTTRRFRVVLGHALKRLIDIVGASTAIILTAPIMLITALLIKLDGQGSVVFKQERIGKEGKRFLMFKFRTMCPEAESLKKELVHLNEMTGPVFKINDDPRVTRVGCFLRKYSVDELPQLLHVLTGKLSLVGPRPALPEEVEKYEPWQRGRLQAKPGLTCLWQVNGRNELDFADWMRLDLEYVEKRSLWLDLRILLKTIPTVLKGTGV
jgi:lipopolysaccharide/colanic/teichoic acid biosynthesis glycosyltransferase